MNTLLKAFYVSLNNENFFNINTYFLTTIVVLCTLSIINKYFPNLYLIFYQWGSYYWIQIRSKLSKFRKRKIKNEFIITNAMESAGYSYEYRQDIFYSNLYTWQRNMGYCRLYDKAAAPLSMIIDCEPIYFNYDNRRWLIEFWKGQYGMTTGGEVGVYSTKGPDLNIPGLFNGTFYHCVGDEDLLLMSITLKKRGNILFRRTRPHWWMTGFKLGEFSEPSDLTMNIFITLKDEMMRNAFIKGLEDAGYFREELTISGNTVGILFDKPRTRQPITRTKLTDSITQRKNKLLCERFQEMTRGYDNSWDRMIAIQENAPEMLFDVLNIGKTKKLFKVFSKIQKYLKIE